LEPNSVNFGLISYANEAQEPSIVLSLFRDHPRTVDETYLQHLRAAMRFASKLSVAALACLIHALLPFLFTARASAIVQTLHREMVSERKGGTCSADSSDKHNT